MAYPDLQFFSVLSHDGANSRFSKFCERFFKLVIVSSGFWSINLLKPTGHVMHQQFNIQQLHVLPTLYLCVLYLSENKQRLVPLIS